MAALPPYIWIKSSRKSCSIQISKDLQVVLRSPQSTTRAEADRLIEENLAWIQEALIRSRARQEAHPEPDAAEFARMVEKARQYIPRRVAYYSRLMGVRPTALKITKARTRFGSCSGKNSICFSIYLMQYPDEAIDYVVVHELAHILQKNHSRLFYQEIAKVMPDYKRREKMLRE